MIPKNLEARSGSLEIVKVHTYIPAITTPMNAAPSVLSNGPSESSGEGDVPVPVSIFGVGGWEKSRSPLPAGLYPATAPKACDLDAVMVCSRAVIYQLPLIHQGVPLAPSSPLQSDASKEHLDLRCSTHSKLILTTQSSFA